MAGELGRIIRFFAYAPEIRKVIYTTNAIVSVNYSLRRVIKTRATFPTDEAAIKLLYLGLRNIAKRWTMPIHNWKQAKSQLMIRFGKQFTPLGKINKHKIQDTFKGIVGHLGQY